MHPVCLSCGIVGQEDFPLAVADDQALRHVIEGSAQKAFLGGAEGCGKREINRRFPDVRRANSGADGNEKVDASEILRKPAYPSDWAAYGTLNEEACKNSSRSAPAPKRTSRERLPFGVGTIP